MMLAAYCDCARDDCEECRDRVTLGLMERARSRVLAQLRRPHSVEIDCVAELIGEACTTLALQIEAMRMRRGK